jgi:hypothetical protein
VYQFGHKVQRKIAIALGSVCQEGTTMSTIKQDTINQHVNLEALAAYADTLQKRAEEILTHAFLRNVTDAEVDAGRSLTNAEAALRLAIDLSIQAVRKSDAIAYARIYQKPGATHGD